MRKQWYIIRRKAVYHQRRQAAFVSHHAIACIPLRLDDIPQQVADNIHAFGVTKVRTINTIRSICVSLSPPKNRTDLSYFFYFCFEAAILLTISPFCAIMKPINIRFTTEFYSTCGFFLLTKPPVGGFLTKNAICCMQRRSRTWIN